jgi:hypothetical protein
MPGKPTRAWNALSGLAAFHSNGRRFSGGKDSGSTHQP